MTQLSQGSQQYRFRAKYEKSEGSTIGTHYIPEVRCTWALRLDEVEAASINYTAILIDGSSFGCSSETPFKLKYLDSKHIFLTFYTEVDGEIWGEGKLTKTA
jgi:hypothetical protein